jgi:phospholipid transport system substrate-binding protein
LLIAAVGCASSAARSDIRASQAPAHAGDSVPSQVIAATADAIARAVAAKHAEYEADPRRLRAVADELLRPRFDLDTSARLILRDHWKSASPDERRRFVAAFYQFLLDSYADALLHFRTDTVTILPGEELAGASTARVRTSMKLRDGSIYQVDYAMRRRADGWKIVDVIAEGVSYVRTYRTDFAAEIRATGLASLIDRLEGNSPSAEKPRTP